MKVFIYENVIYYLNTIDKVTKYKNDLANKVRESFGSVFENIIVKTDEKVNKNELKSNEKILEEIIEKKEVTSKYKLKLEEASKFNNFSSETEKKNDFKVSKTNKIKKVDIDFDFDNFNPGFDNMKIENNKSNEIQQNIFNKPVKDEKPKETSNEITSDFKKKLANKKAISSEDYAER